MHIGEKRENGMVNLRGYRDTRYANDMIMM